MNDERLVFLALEAAERAHRGQWRKVTGLPYIVHPLDVLRRLSSWDIQRDRFPEVWAAALLHDVLEDTEWTPTDIDNHVGVAVRHIVVDLTFRDQMPNESPQEYRAAKHEYLASFMHKSLEALVIKVADRLCNIADYMESDPRYARKYWGYARPLFEAFEARSNEVREHFGAKIVTEVTAFRLD